MKTVHCHLYRRSWVYLQGKDSLFPLFRIIERVVTKVSIDPQRIENFTTTLDLLGKKCSLLSLRADAHLVEGEGLIRDWRTVVTVTFAFSFLFKVTTHKECKTNPESYLMLSMTQPKTSPETQATSCISLWWLYRLHSLPINIRVHLRTAGSNCSSKHGSGHFF